MENGLELFYEGCGVVFFCTAVAVMFLLFHGLYDTEKAVKDNLEESHIISVTLIE